MKIILFEIRKNIIRRNIIIPMVILLCVNAIVLCTGVINNTDLFSDDVTIYNLSKEEWNYYRELHKHFDGTITEKKQDELIELYKNLNKRISSGEFNSEYSEEARTGFFIGDYRLVESQFYLPMKYMVSYADENRRLVDEAAENISFYESFHNRFETEKNQYIVSQYKNRSLNSFFDVNGWKKLFQYNFSDVAVIIFIILCVLPLFYKERISGMEEILICTKRGKKTYLSAKYISIILGIVFFVFLVSITNYIGFDVAYGLKGMGIPVYAIEEYKYTPYGITLFQAYLLLVALKTFGAAVVSTFFCLIASRFYGTITPFVIFVGSVVAGLYISGFICSDNAVLSYLATFSPFSLFKARYLVKELYEVSFMGHFCPRLGFCMFMQVLLEIVLIVVSIMNYKMMMGNRDGRKDAFK